jgi:hypothetical protein
MTAAAGEQEACPMRERIAWGLVAALGLAVIASLAGAVRSGPLDPADTPGPTYRKLGDIAPSWHGSLSAGGACASARFACVLGDGAVLDNETGLVWDEVPDGQRTWAAAVDYCYATNIAGKAGWRLPTVEELRSLVDASAPAPPKLPVGHPFSADDVIATSIDFYWSATTSNTNTANAYAVTFFSGNVNSAKVKSESHYTWCVRGGAAHDAY